jgi:uncharacterized protein YxjI
MLRRRQGGDGGGRPGGGLRGGGGGDGGPVPPNVYQMRQRMFSIGDDYWIENGAGQRAFKVDGKALRVRSTLSIEDASGRELYKIQEKMVRIRDTMDIEGPNGKVASVKKAMITPLRERFSVDLASGGEWNIQGNITDHEYEISGPNGTVATVGKRWFRFTDTYGVEVAPSQDDGLVLAVAVVVDQISHPRG